MHFYICHYCLRICADKKQALSLFPSELEQIKSLKISKSALLRACKSREGSDIRMRFAKERHLYKQSAI